MLAVVRGNYARDKLLRQMKTKNYHHTHLGSYAPAGAQRDRQGYIIYHDSPRYSAASPEQLDTWAESRTTGVRNAALTEIAERALQTWRDAK